MAQILQGLSYKVSTISPKVFAFETFALVFGMSPITYQQLVAMYRTIYKQIFQHEIFFRDTI